MIVDDEPFIRLGLEKIITKMDASLNVLGSFTNGQEALAFLTKHDSLRPDVLITDIKMPMMDGLKLTEIVKGRYPDITIVILSGFSDFEYARAAIRFGVHDYLLKPVDKSVLFDMLRKLREEKRQSSLSAGGVALHRAPAAGSTASNGEEGELEEIGQPTGQAHYIINEIKAILDREFDKNLELDRLAETIGMNASYLSRLFKHKTSMTITDYLINLRIEKAKQFLTAHPHLKNYEISHLVGYSDPVYFNKLFKKVVGLTPKDYKEQHGLE